MGKIAFIFSGQGAQRPGMAQEFYQTNGRVKALFDQAEQLRPGTLAQCFAASPAELKQTDNTQPCLYLTDLAAAIAADEAGIKPAAVAGFSLGEIPALAFAGAYSHQDGFQIACARGRIMAKAAQTHDAAMAAVLKLDHQTVETLCGHYDQVFPVNYNAPGQLVVAGEKDQLKALKQEVLSAGGRIMPLAVSGGFHSPFMDQAAKEFGAYLGTQAIGLPTLPVYANVTGMPYGSAPVAELLEQQVNHPVRWEQIISHMAADGVDTYLEVGVGNVLQKLVLRILPNCRAFAVSTPDELDAVRKELALC